MGHKKNEDTAMKIQRTHVWEFDLRRHVKIGDRILFNSMWRCENACDVGRYDMAPYEADVVAVYERFCMVQLKRLVECVNRWDILQVNGKTVNFGSDAGRKGKRQVCGY